MPNAAHWRKAWRPRARTPRWRAATTRAASTCSTKASIARAPRCRPRRARRGQRRARSGTPAIGRGRRRKRAGAQRRLNDLAGAAPAAGTIEHIYHRPGEVVAAGQPIASLLTPANHEGAFLCAGDTAGASAAGRARVWSRCDGCAEGLTGTVSFIAREPQFTPPVIYSLEQREKLVFLVEARLDTPGAIRPGMPRRCADRAQ